MAAPYILAPSFAEAHRFAREDLGLDLGHYRVVNSAGTLKAVRGVDLYLVPGWRKRYDRFVMQSALRWTKMNVIDVETEPVKEPTPERVDTMPEWTDSNIVETLMADATEFVTSLPADIDAPLDQPGPPQPADVFEPVVAGVTGTTLLDPDTDEALPAPVGVAPEPEEAPKKNRRRSRCKDCGTLHFKEDACAEGDS